MSLDFYNNMFSNNQALQLKVKKKMQNPTAENSVTRKKQLHWNALVICEKRKYWWCRGGRMLVYMASRNPYILNLIFNG